MSHTANAQRWRDLLIALNTVVPGSRDTVCKLAANPSAWTGLHPSAAPKVAPALNVPAGGLRDAIALLPEASGIARRETEAARQVGARIITRFEPDYPSTLLHLALPPPALYCRGTLEELPAVAIVGSRRSDPYGLEASRLFASDLGLHGLAVVSGLALGVDAAAHRGALDAGATTIAVLGCGIDVTYPYRNRRLAADIVDAGAVISEFPLGSEPQAWRFPIRNRIIAALAAGVLVVRATPKSGSLITARHALELGRDVYAIPGNIFDQRSIGTNSLIRDGALPVQHPREIVEALPTAVHARLTCRESPTSPRKALAADLDGRLATLLSSLPIGETVSEELVVERSTLPLDETLAALLELEMLGLITRHPGPHFLRSAGGLLGRRDL